jgi:hypothetical protein
MNKKTLFTLFALAIAAYTNFAFAVLLTTELKFDHNIFLIKEVPLQENIITSKITMNKNPKQEVIWMKLEASPIESLEDICKFDHGKIINLKFKNSSLSACYSDERKIGFKSQIYKGTKLFNINRFLFPVGTKKSDIESFFSEVKYVPEVLK